MRPEQTPPAIELRNINKRFGNVHANKDVSMSVAKGTIHGVVGENGAGKSTLMSILYGFYQADSGEILLNGKPVQIKTTQDSIGAGIGMVFQHFMLIDSFTVLENIILGAEDGAFIAAAAESAREKLNALERDYGLEVDLDALVGSLSVGVQQRVEVLKALYRDAAVLILDEPTGVLTPQEADRLFVILTALKSRGVTVILITHKLREIMAVTDAVSIMRAGTMVTHLNTAETDEATLAELMVGRKISQRGPLTSPCVAQCVLEVTDAKVTNDAGVVRVNGVSFAVHAGEIVGIAGVSGNGQSELLDTLSGIRPLHSGSITVGGRQITRDSPCDARAMRGLGVAHVPEDRLRMGLVGAFTANESAILGHHAEERFSAKLLSRRDRIVSTCQEYMNDFDIRPSDPMLGTENFSGGNQQKLVLAREMTQRPKVLLVGQPTRGVDIGAIEFIHERLVAMRDAGAAILLVSVELDEIMALADRILVMFAGRIVGELEGKTANERDIGLMMANIVPEQQNVNDAMKNS